MDGKGEHAVKAGHAFLTPGVPGLDDDFRVAIRKEPITLGFEFRAQFAEIINAAVKDNADAKIGINHGLLGFFR